MKPRSLLLSAISLSISSTVPNACEAFSAASSLKDNNILILDHLNINHQKGRHDWLKAFYVDFLQCALDPRKIENVHKGTKTIWANIGSNQFHLPEGKPYAQVLDGVVTLVYPDLNDLRERGDKAKLKLKGSTFEIKYVQADDAFLEVRDPWGSKFHLVSGDPSENRDCRGKQPGEESAGFAMRDLTIHTPPNANLAGIGRFYEQVLGATVSKRSYGADADRTIQIEVGPRQTLTFKAHPSTTIESHVDMRQENVEKPEGQPDYLSNYGPHVSMYVKDLPTTYQRASSLGLAYVNPRFKRRAYTLEEAIDDCMFRCLDIIDPENLEEGPIIKLEHEVRSVLKRDGSMYKSCPFDDIPEGCTS